MKNKAGRMGIIFLALSLVLAMGAFGIFCHNVYSSYKAEKESEKILEEWDDMDLKADSTSNDFVRTNQKDSYNYILEIPALDLTLPVNSEWTTKASESSPCRYKGSVSESNLIIAGHNYPSHFGSLGQLQLGDKVYVTDVQQKKHKYKVTDLEIIDGTAVDDMQSGDWDLTLFTCNYAGNKRITVRCQSV